MADTWRENAIVQAIQIIADKKISQAGYDRTIKGVINKVIDSASGKYQIRYQDSLFEAYATSSKIIYNKDQEVSILIPGNDWDRTKTILSGVNNSAINYQQVPIVSDSYNTIGPNGSSLSEQIKLSSYVDESKVLIEGQGISFSDISDYIKKGDSIALGMKVRTAFASGQIGGRYGLRFNLVFKETANKENYITKSFEVDTSDVIGHPYQLINPQWVETLITGVETQNFVRVDSIEAFCNDFPYDESKSEIKDIFISDIKINGADALSDQDLSKIILHIDCSEKGNVLEGDITEIPLLAELKVGGKVTTEKVVYYWFRQNGTIFRGSDRYSGYASDGWECLNYKDNNTFVPKTVNNFSFNTTEDNLANNTALVPQKVMKVLCVAVYDNKQWIKGEIEVINNNIEKDINIIIEENGVETGRTIYYLDNGHPDLVCQTDLEGTLEYIWSVKPARGRGEQQEESGTDYAAVVIQWNRVQNKRIKMDQPSAARYVKSAEYTNAKQSMEQVQSAPIINGNTYYNFPIHSIVDYSVVSCAVKQDGQYKGTASVTLYNKIQLEGMYSLNLEYGTQVFQYDGKGNSPASPQVERPLEIQPLSFTLIDNEGHEVPYQQIINNGQVKWIIPNIQTLLESNQTETHITGDLDLTVIRADLPLAADRYDVYTNLKTFSYSIANQYDAKKDINYIWLHIKYKDMQFDAYTNFTFPKDGDPGTNGTDYVAKLIPSTGSDRIYISDKLPTTIFDDNGITVDSLKFQLYNNSIKTNLSANYWTCPPVTSSSAGVDNKSSRGSSYLTQNGSWSKPKLNVSGKTLANIQADKPVNIIRAQYGTGTGQNALKYFAECPVCTEFVNSNNYRLKIRPKTGFQYAVYLEDGTRPDYDNTMPFEIVVQKYESNYWIEDQTTRTYTWYAIGNIEPATLTGKTAAFKPKNTFNGSDLSSAVVCEVSGVGRIHVPIYMILNRYGHNALNGWDGNSIQLNANGDTILAPQVGAGSKDDNNRFNGVLIGSVKSGNKTPQTGLFGYNAGQRSIFLDSDTGNAYFGKNTDARINIGADKVGIAPRGSIYSSGYYNYDTSGTPASTAGAGMLIDLISPQIRFGSGRFYVTSNGNIHASGDGDIAGWRINDDAFYKHDGTNKTGMRSSGNPAFYAGTNAQSSITPSSTTAYNFFVNHNGYLYSKLGQIAKWSIDSNALTNGNVGMGQGKIITANTFNNQSSQITNARIWSGTGTGNNQVTFAVDSNGKLWSKSGQIGPWALTNTELSNGSVGMGTKVFNYTDVDSQFGDNEGDKDDPKNKTGRVWGINSSNKPTFILSDDGWLYARNGVIGGWHINGSTGLWAVNSTNQKSGIRINANGSLTGGQSNSEYDYTWAINANGRATFNNLIANKSGQIAGWNITANELTSPGNSMVINKAGSMSGPNWSIDTAGNATFSYINGKIANTDGNAVSLTGGSGGYSGNGYTLKSDGSFRLGGSGGSLDFSNGTLKIGPWTINNSAIYYGDYPKGSSLMPSGLSVIGEKGTSSILGGSILTGTYQAKSGGAYLSGSSGTMTFSDGSKITVTGGIITSVSPGEDTKWD